MNIITLLLLALALSMDCFAVAIGTGVSNRDLKVKKFLFIAAIFGVAHFIMPILGWFIGAAFQSYIETFDHWIAFVLLFIIGVKMLLESKKKMGDKSFTISKFSVIILLAIATSIDALIVGLSLALFDYNLLLSAAVISTTAFVISFFGFIVGRKFGCLCGNKAELIGGVILIAIGTKILLEHLFII